MKCESCCEKRLHKAVRVIEVLLGADPVAIERVKGPALEFVRAFYREKERERERRRDERA